MSDWYYAVDNEQKGPINESELKANFATNKLPVDTLVWKDGMDAWTAANMVPAFSFRPPPAPAKIQPTAEPVATTVATTTPLAEKNDSTTPVVLSDVLGKPEALEVDAEDAEKNRIFGILAYIPLLFFIPLVAAKGSAFGKYHANQGLVLLIVWIAVGIVLSILNSILLAVSLSSLSFIFGLIWLAPLALLVMGIINAAAGKCVPLPVIGGVKLIK